MDDIKGLTPHASRVNGTVSVATIPWRFTYLCWNIPWWVERVLPMAAVATRISTFGHGLPLLPTLADHQCVGSSVPWRPGKTGDSAVEGLFTGKTWVGLRGVRRWVLQG